MIPNGIDEVHYIGKLVCAECNCPIVDINFVQQSGVKIIERIDGTYKVLSYCPKCNAKRLLL